MFNDRGQSVDLRLKDGGAVCFLGQVLAPGQAEYEHAITVEADDVPKMITALGGTAGDDVAAILVANATTIVGSDERAWLHSIGIKYGFWHRMGQ